MASSKNGPSCARFTSKPLMRFLSRRQRVDEDAVADPQRFLILRRRRLVEDALERRAELRDRRTACRARSGTSPSPAVRCAVRSESSPRAVKSAALGSSGAAARARSSRYSAVVAGLILGAPRQLVRGDARPVAHHVLRGRAMRPRRVLRAQRHPRRDQKRGHEQGDHDRHPGAVAAHGRSMGSASVIVPIRATLLTVPDIALTGCPPSRGAGRATLPACVEQC